MGTRRLGDHALYERNDWEHQAIIAALRARSASGAPALAREHVLHSFELLVQVLDRFECGSGPSAVRS
jgi:DNA-binding GntR family transcriptional regulator